MIQSAEFSLSTAVVQEVDLSAYKGGTLTICAYGDSMYFVLNCDDSTAATSALAATTNTFAVSNRVLIASGGSVKLDVSGIKLLHFKRSASTTVNVFLILDDVTKVV
jgi:hypothetical protein